MKRFLIRISGTVQGVFFRDSARRKALELGVTGTVRNEPDGSLAIEAEGDEAALKEFAAWCGHGPSAAIVEKVDIEEADVIGYDDFTIIVL